MTVHYDDDDDDGDDGDDDDSLMVWNDQVGGDQSQFATDPVTLELFIAIDDDLLLNSDDDDDDDDDDYEFSG